MERNQYPSSFYEPIIKNTLRNIIERTAGVIEPDAEEQEVEKKLLFVQYRERLSDHYERELRKMNALAKLFLR